MPECKILVVEDEAIVAMDIRQRLETMGYEVTATVADGAAALDQVEANRPNLALMDIQIKGDIDGIETAALIQERFDIPIIFLTANSDLKTVERAKRSGPLAYVLKPFEDRELLTSIEIAVHRHELEQRLKASEAWLETVLRSIGDAVIVTDRNGDIMFMNPEAEALTEWSLAEVNGKGSAEVLKLVNEEADQPIENPIGICLKNGELVALQNHTALLTKSGKRVFIEDSAAPINSKRGELIGCVMVFRDVTERIKVEKELKRHREHLDELVKERTAELSKANEQLQREISERREAQKEVQSIVRFPNENPGPVLRILSDHTISYANKASAPVLHTWNCQEKQEVPEEWKTKISEVLKAGEISIVEITIGEQIYSLVLSPVPESSYVNIYGRDITKQRESEESERKLRLQLERAQRAESLAILAGGVAHDLNNMLGPMVGYPELILRKLPPDNPVRKQVERIGVSAKEAADVIQDLLTLARRGRYDMAPVCFDNVIRDFFGSPVFAELQQSNPDVKVNLKLDDSPQNIRGSSQQLSKLFMNLVINAFDAMPEGGTLTIETCHEYLEKLQEGYDGIESGDYTILRVSDTGVGIAQEHLGRVFEPYYSSKKLKGHCGTGLGLAVVYGVLKDHGGYFDVVSQVGKGTEFIIYLPTTTESEATVTDGDDYASGEWTGDEKVLVVDDDEGARELAKECLSTLGYAVAVAANGREAVEYIKVHSADIVVLDMIMEEGFDGLVTYREIVRLYPHQKAIIVSGYSATDRVEEARRLGVGAYIKKPYSLKTMAKTVRKELDRSVGVESTS